MGELAGEVEVKPMLVDITFLAPKVKYCHCNPEVRATESIVESLDVCMVGVW